MGKMSKSVGILIKGHTKLERWCVLTRLFPFQFLHDAKRPQVTVTIDRKTDLTFIALQVCKPNLYVDLKFGKIAQAHVRCSNLLPGLELVSPILLDPPDMILLSFPDPPKELHGALFLGGYEKVKQ